MTKLDTWFGRALETCCGLEGVRPCTAVFRVVSDEEMRELNRDTRGIDRATDVLSYPAVSYPKGKTARDCPKRLNAVYDPEFGKPNLGDVFLSLERVRQQAKEYGHHIIGTESCFDIFAGDLLQNPLLDPGLVVVEVKYNGFLLSYIKDMMERCNASELSVGKYSLSRALSKHYQF